MSTRRRTVAREIAVQILKQIDVHRGLESGEESGEVDDPADKSASNPVDAPFDIESFITSKTEDPEARSFCRELCRGAIEGMQRSDRLIAEIADNWDFDRIASLDKAILRLAVYELTDSTEVPPKVVINEAIELAKKYSTAQSGAFINGILDRLMLSREADGDEKLWDLGK